MKGLKFRHAGYSFLINTDYILHIAPFKEVENELTDFELVDFGKLFFDRDTYFGDIIFIHKGEKIKAVLVDTVEKIVSSDEILSFENKIFMVNYISGKIEQDNEMHYVVDAEKILGVNYE